jgi:hypothetical protein
MQAQAWRNADRRSILSTKSNLSQGDSTYMNKKLFSTAGALLVTAGMILIPGGHAAAADAGVAVFSAPTSHLDTVPPAPTTGGTGHYTFGAGGLTPAANLCVGVSTTGGAGAPCNLKSNGHYVNTICGTGAAYGDSGASDTTLTTGSAAYNNIQYTINFFAGVGVITGTANGPAGAGSVAGVVQILPTGGGCAPSQGGVSTFTANGVVITNA